MASVGLHMTKFTVSEAITLSKQILVLTKSEKEGVIDVKIKEAAELLVSISGLFTPTQQTTYIERRTVDSAVDTIFYAAYNLLEAYNKLYSQTVIPLTEGDEIKKEATTELLAKVFPSGAGFLSESWVRQYGGMSMVVDCTSDPEIQDSMAVMNVEHVFVRMKKGYDLYGSCMGFSEVTEEGKETANILKDWYDALEEYLVTVMFLYKRDSVMRTKLEAPYTKLVDSIREARRRKNKN